jgi:hypothetical protein
VDEVFIKSEDVRLPYRIQDTGKHGIFTVLKD